jgi:hypothetical protein
VTLNEINDLSKLSLDGSKVDTRIVLNEENMISEETTLSSFISKNYLKQKFIS